MSPAEINGLQHLAIAHGGSLTINPTTGLPEASFMKDWLPSILGGLTMLIPGIGPFAAMALAAGTSFGTSMAVGNSFNKSLMAGLASGAGAGIGGALGGAGAAAAGEAGALTAKAGTAALANTGTRAATTAAIDAGVTGLEQAGLNAAKFGATDFAGSSLGGLTRVGAQSPTILPTTGVASNVGSALYNPATALATRGPSQATQFFSTAMPTGGRLPVDQIPGLSTKAVEFTPGLSNQAIFKAAGPMEKLSLMKQGAGEALKSPEAAGEFAWNNKGKLLALGTGVAGNMMSDPQPLRAPLPEKSDYAGPYMPTPRTTQFPIGPQSLEDTSEFQYFSDINPYPGYIAYDPKKKTTTAADGGLMGLAGGGSYDDEAGHDGYADGGEVGTRMATPDMSAIQNYVQSINQPQQGDPNALQNYMRGLNPQQGDPNALQNYLNNIGRGQQQPTSGRPQVPDILRQLQAMPQQAPQLQAPIAGGGEHNYGFKPITVQQAPPVQYAPATKQKVNGMELLFSGMMGKKAEPVPIVDKYTPYRPQTTEYTDLNNRVYNPETQQMEIPLAVGGLTSLARGGSYLDGPGDGLSDSIHATIGNNQPARLADGEFVISADVVSDIGGGSSKAGAKKLHAMMDRVRQSAHGTKKQVKKINDRKVLAA
jgi:hypothetical protein